MSTEAMWIIVEERRPGRPAHRPAYLPQQSGYNKRLTAGLPLVKKAIRLLATDTAFWFDNHWIVDSTPADRGCSRPTVKR